MNYVRTMLGHTYVYSQYAKSFIHQIYNYMNVHIYVHT